MILAAPLIALPPGNWRLLQGVVYLDVRIAVGLRKRYALPGHTSVACYPKKSSPRVHLVSTFFWLQKHHLTVFKLVPISFCLISKPPFSGGCNCWSPSCEETNKQIKQILWTEVGLLHCRHVLCMLAASTPCPSRVGPADQTCDIVDDQDKGHCTGRETSQ